VSDTAVTTDAFDKEDNSILGPSVFQTIAENQL